MVSNLLQSKIFVQILYKLYISQVFPVYAVLLVVEAIAGNSNANLLCEPCPSISFCVIKVVEGTSVPGAVFPVESNFKISACICPPASIDNWP